MRTTPPENFDLDRLPTPIGTALLVTDADGNLRALDWEDYEARMKELLRLHYGAVEPEAGAGAARAANRAIGYFKGDLDRLAKFAGASRARRSSRRSGTHCPEIPAGTTMSYGALAAKIELPRAVRAVGHANGSNPISVVLPCHRLIGANGSLVKYGGGLERKRWLLQHEGVEI